MIRTFNWKVERDVQPTLEYQVITSQFGDGYKQTSTEGVNTRLEQYAITVHAYKKEAKEIMNFFDEHQGWKSFFWTPPLGDVSLYTCVDPKPTEIGGGLYTITATFVKSYSAAKI